MRSRPYAVEVSLPAPATHAQRLQRAQRIARDVLAAYGERVHAIGVYGSTARGLDRPYSDLEMAVVLPGLKRRARQEFYAQGWKTEVEYWSPDLLRGKQRQVDLSWPFRGGQFAKVLALHDPHDFWSAVADFVPDEEAFRAALREALVGEYLEHVGKYLNALEAGQGEQQRLAYVALAQDALGLAGLLNRRWYVSRATAVQESLAFEVLPAGHEALLRCFTQGDLRNLATLEARVAAYHEGVLRVAAQSSVALQEEQLPVIPPSLEFT